MLVLLLDAYHLGDPLFLTGLARDLQARGAGLVVVHGTGERGERALEALGLDPRAEGGAWITATEEERGAVERSGRDLNREIAHELNEAGIAAVRVLGADRGLLKRGPDRRLDTGRVGWVGDLVRQGAVPVVAAFVEGPGRALDEVEAAHAASLLAARLDAEVGVLTPTRLDVDGPIPLSAVGPAAAEAERALEFGGRVVALDRTRLRGGTPGVPVGDGGETGDSGPSEGGRA